jgi:hypothetical protein
MAESVGPMTFVNSVTLRISGISLTRGPGGDCTVSIQVGGRWVAVIEDNGDLISHIVEPLGILSALDDPSAQRR